MLQEKNLESQLIGTWHFNGRYYMNDDCETTTVHPNMENLIKAYLEEVNAVIKDYNTDIDKQSAADKDKYDHAVSV